MTTPDISFVITVYNKAPYLKGVIAALKAQRGDFTREFIFIDDGSTDGSWDVLREAASDLDGVALIRQDNQGPARATNAAVARAQGTFIKPVDADDLLTPDATRFLLYQARNRDLDLLFGGMGHYAGDAPAQLPELSDMDIQSAEATLFTDPLRTVIDRGFAMVSHTLFKRAAFDKGGGCDPRVFIQDTSLYLRLARHVNLAQFKDTLIALAPEAVPGRIMNNQAQLSHDAALSLAHFLADNPDLGATYKALGTRKVTGRAWRWAKRKLGHPPLSSFHRLALKARLGMRVPPEALIDACAVFREDAAVRLP